MKDNARKKACAKAGLSRGEKLWLTNLVKLSAKIRFKNFADIHDAKGRIDWGYVYTPFSCWLEDHNEGLSAKEAIERWHRGESI